MKNVYLYIIFLLISLNSFGQGVDVIFLLDNSGSIEGNPVNQLPPLGTEYRDMYESVQKIMGNVLECHPDNKVSVIQYSNGGPNYGDFMYIESDFTNTQFPFIRRYNNNDDLWRFMGHIGNALNGTVDPVIKGVSTLHRTSGNMLVVFVYTDAESVGIIDPSTGVNINQKFAYFDNFKATYNAKIITALKNTNSDERSIGAAISSLGGSYYGSVKSYSLDPYGPGATPRYFFPLDFVKLSDSQIEIATEQICMSGGSTCRANLVLTATNNVVSPLQDNRQAQNTITASNVINNGAVGIYHAGTTVVLKPGFHGVGGSRFRGYIEDCSGQFVGLRASAEEEILNVIGKEIFTLYPNPAADRTVIVSDKMMAHIEVKSLTGTIFYSGKVNDKSHELYIGNYPKGFYMVMVTTDTGEVEVKKLIKD